MCGILLLLNNTQSEEKIISNFSKGKARGPESNNIKFLHNDKAIFGFHRLAINGLKDSANQPMTIDGYTLICNGEIYNYRELHTYFAIENSTGSDCEIIIHLYKKYGIEQTLRFLDGVFAFALFDRAQNKIVVARDLFGVRPLFMSEINSIEFGVASEIKMLADSSSYNQTIKPFAPGTYSIYEFVSSPLSSVRDVWTKSVQNKPFDVISPSIKL